MYSVVHEGLRPQIPDDCPSSLLFLVREVQFKTGHAKGGAALRTACEGWKHRVFII